MLRFRKFSLESNKKKITFQPQVYALFYHYNEKKTYFFLLNFHLYIKNSLLSGSAKLPLSDFIWFVINFPRLKQFFPSLLNGNAGKEVYSTCCNLVLAVRCKIFSYVQFYALWCVECQLGFINFYYLTKCDNKLFWYHENMCYINL